MAKGNEEKRSLGGGSHHLAPFAAIWLSRWTPYMKPFFSLLICTLGRTSELTRMLTSLQAQTFRDFEIILVDQNDNDQLTPILSPFLASFPLLHLRSQRGLSHGRNVGLTHTNGAIIAFPDDDCEYPPTLLEQLADMFNRLHHIDGICGRHVDVHGLDVLARFDRDPGYISNLNVWRRSSSATIFLRNAVTNNVGPFDERLGVGSGTPWGAGEETDYLCRAMEMGHQLLYDPKLCVLHPRPPVDNSPAGRLRASFYSRGMGFVLGKHRYPPWFSAYMMARPLGGALADVVRWRFDSAILRLRVAHSRATGYMESLPARSEAQNAADRLSAGK